MRNRLFILILSVLALMMLAGSALAQGAPDPINDALADFNQRIGRTLTLNDFNWSWEQRRFPDTSLGCPQAGEVYAQVEVVGYRFLFTWNNEIYDYRVSADRSLLVFCGATPVDQTQETPVEDDDEAYSNPLCPAPPAGITYMQTRLSTGIQARVQPGLPNRVRAEPSTTGAITGEIPGGGIFTVLNGPACDAEGYVWWEIDYDGFRGWTAEGRGGTYFIEPLPPAALPANLAPLTAENIANVNEMSRLQGNFVPGLAWSWAFDSPRPAHLVALGAPGSEGAWLYNMSAITEAPRIVPGTVGLTSVAFGRDADLALFGSANGGLRLWDIRPGVTLVERTFLQGHDSPVMAVAFSGDGRLLASSGGRAFLREDQPDNINAITLWNVVNVSINTALRGHTAPVTGIIFWAENSHVASSSLDGTIRIWNLNVGNQPAIVMETGLPVRALAMSWNEGTIAAAHDDGSISLWSPQTGERLQTLSGGHPLGSAVNALAFSPDGSLLASAGEGGEVVVWSLSADEERAPVTLTGHTGAVVSVLFNIEGTLLVTLGEDNTIRLWGAFNTVG